MRTGRLRMDPTPDSAPAPVAGARMHWPALLVGLAIMVAGTALPSVMTNAEGKADHGLATLLLWAMAAGFVRGVGFVPRHPVSRLLLSGWACAACLASFAVLRWAA